MYNTIAKQQKYGRARYGDEEFNRCRKQVQIWQQVNGAIAVQWPQTVNQVCGMMVNDDALVTFLTNYVQSVVLTNMSSQLAADIWEGVKPPELLRQQLAAQRTSRKLSASRVIESTDTGAMQQALWTAVQLARRAHAVHRPKK